MIPRIFIFFFTLVLGFANAKLCWAHEMHETSASITLRDQAVEIEINVELLEWLRKQPSQERNASNPAESMERLILAEKSMGEAAFLADEKAIPLRIAQFPNIADVVEALKMRDKGKHFRTTIKMKAALSSAKNKRISLRLPAEMGNVNVILLKPTSKYARGGNTVSFAL